MKSFLIAFIVFLVWSFFGLWLYSWLQPLNSAELAEDLVSSENIQNELEIPTILTNSGANDSKIDSLNITNRKEKEDHFGLKAVNYEGDVVFLFDEGMGIVKNSPLVTIPESIVDFKYKLNTYMLEHPENELHIMSMYGAGENIETPNLGIQRAKMIRDILISTGVHPDKIVIKPVIKELTFNENETYANGVSFYFKPLDNKRLENLKNKPLTPNTKVVYPKFSSQGIMVNDALQELLKEVVLLVESNPEIKIEVIGHTDNIGNDTDNYTEGLSYARQVRWYLVTKGNIDRKQVIATSKGESEPIANNGSLQGRQTNKRIEVSFQ